MQLAKVIGTVVSSRKDPGISGFKLLVLRNANPENLELGGYVVAADAVGAGVDEFVLYATGSSARQTQATKNRPCDAVIMAIVDQWSIDGESKWQKSRTDYGYGDGEV